MSDEFSLHDSWHKITVIFALLIRVWTELKYHLDICSPVWVIFFCLFYDTLNDWTIWCQMAGCLMNDELERIWKEAAMV
jgi:hypothetical protein